MNFEASGSRQTLIVNLYQNVDDYAFNRKYNMKGNLSACNNNSDTIATSHDHRRQDAANNSDY